MYKYYDMNWWRRKKVMKRMNGKLVADMDEEELEVWGDMIVTAVRAAKNRPKTKGETK